MDQTAVSQSNYRILYFWHADKHGSLLQVDTVILGVCNQACTQNKEFAYPCNISRKKGLGGRGKWGWVRLIFFFSTS